MDKDRLDIIAGHLGQPKQAQVREQSDTFCHVINYCMYGHTDDTCVYLKSVLKLIHVAS